VQQLQSYVSANGIDKIGIRNLNVIRMNLAAHVFAVLVTNGLSNAIRVRR
jgi:hypothetical protein